MKKLSKTAEAQGYPPEIRGKVLKLVGGQLLLEWRFWLAFVMFIAGVSVITSAVEGLDIAWHWRFLMGLILLFPIAFLWMVISLKLQRWVLLNRRMDLLRAVGAVEGVKG